MEGKRGRLRKKETETQTERVWGSIQLNIKPQMSVGPLQTDRLHSARNKKGYSCTKGSSSLSLSFPAFLCICVCRFCAIFCFLFIVISSFVLFLSDPSFPPLFCLHYLFNYLLPCPPFFFSISPLPSCLLTAASLSFPRTFSSSYLTVSLSSFSTSSFSLSLTLWFFILFFFIAPLPLKLWYPLHKGHISAG